MISCFKFGSILVLAVVLAGCGGGAQGPKLHPVDGQVTLDGKPVVGATVEFSPDTTKGTKGPKATGITDKDGRFKLMGAAGVQGAVAGHHIVTITCPPPASETSSDSSTPSTGPAEPCKVPAKYSTPATSDITKQVEAGNNSFPIELKSEAQ